ncbi:MAG: DUF983 domain-containing protein [Vicingaceae bacterium]|nr:DUF983 domain-containing protein [Vicingaceae bacterium]
MANQVVSVFRLKCPQCGEGDLFCNKNIYKYKGFFDMPDSCPKCQQDFQIEPGFYYGSMYVSYGLTIAITVAIFVAMTVLNIFSIAGFIIADVVILTVTLPIVFKISRALWLTMNVKKSYT